MSPIKVNKKKGGDDVYHAVERKAPNGSIDLFATKEDIEHRTSSTHYVSHNKQTNRY